MSLRMMPRLALLAVCAVCAAVSEAAPSSKPPPTLPAHVRSPYFSAMAIDAATGRVLFESRADASAYPASISKLMTAFIVLDDVKAGLLSLDDKVTASPTRTKLDVHLRQPSNTGLKPGESMTVREMLALLLVRSANDAAVFLAEKCSGSMEAFVARMNGKAKSLGMDSTVYFNPNGLPPLPGAKSGFNESTCRDLTKLAVALLADHPDILAYTSIKVLTVTMPSGKKIQHVNHNNVMVKNAYKVINPDGSEAADGMKTGYIAAGGSSVLLTGKRGRHRAIVVVLGSPCKEERDAAARNLLEDALDALSIR